MTQPVIPYGAFLTPRARAIRRGQKIDTTPRPLAIRAEIAVQRDAGSDQDAAICAAWTVLEAEYLPHLPGGVMTRDDRNGLMRVLARDMGVDVETVQGVLG